MDNRGFVAKNPYDMYRTTTPELTKTLTVAGNDAKGAPGSPHMHAPGSPGSSNDKQTISILEKELEQSKIKEMELRKLLGSKTGYSNSEGFPMDESTFESTSCKDLDENVRDAYIKHLQRQVTILQANLYKAEGWETRATAILKERDDARDQVLTLTKRNESLEAEKEKLLMDLQHKLRQCQQCSVQLKEENSKLQGDKTFLEEQMAKLRLESQRDSLQSSNGQPSSQSHQSLTSNPACTQELDYLHNVVDLLKSTVMEQRNLLLNIKHPSGASSMPQIRELPVPNRPPKLSSSGSSSFILTKNGEKSSVVPAANFVEESETRMNIKVPDLPRRTSQGWNLPRPESGDHRINVMNHDGQLNAPMDDEKRAEVFTGHGPQQAGHSGNGYFHLSSPSKSTQHVNEYSNNNSNVPSKTNLRQPTNTNNREALQNFHKNHEMSHSEVLMRRTPSENLVSTPQSKSESFKQNPKKTGQHKAGDYPMWLLSSAKTAKSNADNYVEFVPPALSQQQPQSQSSANVVTDVDPRRASTSSPLLHVPLQPNIQQQQIYHHPGMRNNNISHMESSEPAMFMTGHMTNGSSVDHVYHNANGGLQETTTSSSHQPNLNADRLCPVCNHEFGSFSMEDFQTHVFECFDDENGPETMMPAQIPPAAFRACPMCDARFDQGMPQKEFERHVHSHFDSEELNFEILQA